MKNLRYCALILTFIFWGFCHNYMDNKSHSLSPIRLLFAGNSVLLPVVINGVDDENPVISGEWTLTLTNNIAAIDRVETTGTLLDGKSVLFNPTTRRLAFALSDSITTNGILLYLEVQVREDAGKFQRANIGLQDILLNEDLVEVNTEPGSVTVQGVAVNPSGIVQPVVVGNTVQFTATGNTVLPVTWRTSNENFATINQDGLLQAVSPGNVRVYITDCHLDSRTQQRYFRVAPENLNDLTLSFGSISVFQNIDRYPLHRSIGCNRVKHHLRRI